MSIRCAGEPGPLCAARRLPQRRPLSGRHQHPAARARPGGNAGDDRARTRHQDILSADRVVRAAAPSRFRPARSLLAVVVPRPGEAPTIAALDDHCRERLAGYKRPKQIVLVDSLPRNASGKVLKRELRDRFIGDGEGEGRNPRGSDQKPWLRYEGGGSFQSPSKSRSSRSRRIRARSSAAS